MKSTAIICLLVLFLVASHAGLSQTPIAVGIKAGVASSQLRMVELGNVMPGRFPFSLKESSPSPVAAIFLRSRAIDFFPVSLSLQYHRIGGSWTEQIPVTTEASPESAAYYLDYRSESGFHFLSAALAIEPTMDILGCELYVTAAPTLSYLMLADNFAALWKGYHRTLFGFQIGGGFRLPREDGSDLILEIAYREQFSPFYAGTSSYVTTVVNREYSSVTWLATLGIAL